MVWNLLGLFASIVVPGIILGLGAYFTQKLFNLQITSDYTITSKIGEPVCLGFCVLDLHNYLPSFLKQIDSLDGSLLHCTVNMCLWVQFSLIACHQHFGCLLSTYTVFLSVTSSVSVGRKVNLVKETPGKEDCEFGVSPRKKEM